MKQSDPTVQQYTEVCFDDDQNFYLRNCDLTFAPNWNRIGILWYKMVEGSWDSSYLMQDELETKYQLCLKQL